MSVSSDLWDRVHAAFVGHSTHDPSTQAGLERIAQKCLGLSERRPFNPFNCTIRVEQLSPAELDSLVRYHQRFAPKRDGGAIVVLEFEGRRFAIDGNNRVNKWVRSKLSGPFEAIVISPHDAA